MFTINSKSVRLFAMSLVIAISFVLTACGGPNGDGTGFFEKALDKGMDTVATQAGGQGAASNCNPMFSTCK